MFGRNAISRQQVRNAFLFVLVIIISFVPFVYIYDMIDGEGITQQDIMFRVMINLPVCIFIGWVDTMVVRYVGRRLHGSVLVPVVDLCITTVLCVLTISTLNYLFIGGNQYMLLIKSALPAVPWNWIMTLLIELFFNAMRQTEMEKEKALWQFKMLKNQVNPHFLFNSLNVLSSLAYQDAEKTNLFAKKLSSVYRYLLATHERPTVTLGEELDFVRSYLYLEQIRFGEALHMEIVRCSAEVLGRQVIPASIQMLVENAIKHNVCTHNAPLSISVAADDGGVVVTNNLQVRNYVNRSGTGLDNLRRQYAMYGMVIEAGGTPDGRFVVTLPFVG